MLCKISYFLTLTVFTINSNRKLREKHGNVTNNMRSKANVKYVEYIKWWNLFRRCSDTKI